MIAVAVAICSYAAGLWLLWHPIFSAIHHGESTQNVIKNYYLGDQLTYMSIAANVQHGLGAYVEPFTAHGAAIYPSGYYWVLGVFARLTDANVFAAWNIIGMVATVGLMAVAGAWCRWATRSVWGWCLGAAPIFTGTLQWFTAHTWKTLFGQQSMLWPPFAILFNPGAETPGLAFCLLSILLMTRALSIDRRFDGRRRALRLMVAAGASAGLELNVHTYAGLYTITIAAVSLLVWQLFTPQSRRATTLTILAIAAVLLAGTLNLIGTALGLLGLVLAAIVAPLLIVRTWRRQTGAFVIVYFATCIVVALPVFARIGVQSLDPNSYFYFRQDIARHDARSLPFWPVVLQMIPVLAVFGGALVFAFRHQREDRRDRAWTTALIATGITSFMMMFNAAWGFNQEPYRFLPYGIFMLTALAVPIVLRAAPGRNAVTTAARIAFVACLVVTFPTAYSFYRDTGSMTLRVAPQEQATYQRIANVLSDGGITLLDTCIPQRTFKVVTDARIADMNPGLAFPTNYEAMRTVLIDQGQGVLSSDAKLRAAGVTNFVTMNHCNYLSDAELKRRFGRPETSVAMNHATDCGLPPDAQYSIYKVGNDGTDVKSATFDKAKPFDDSVTPTRQCAIEAPFWGSIFATVKN